MSEGKIYICPTPIGNMGDISARVVETLRIVDSICAEDTRVTRKILKKYDIETSIERLDEATMSKRLDELMRRVRAGENIAYCSDAGMPGVSDPGLRLVRAAQEACVSYEVLPGPSAVTTAYVASGFVQPCFYFGGFLPRKAHECTSLLAGLKTLNASLIFYESPKRLTASLGVIAEVFPFREVAVCRELTKLHEEVIRMPAPELYTFFIKKAGASPIRGEVVVLIDAPNALEHAQNVDECSLRATDRARELKEQGKFSNKDIVQLLQEEFDLARNSAYDIVVTL